MNLKIAGGLALIAVAAAANPAFAQSVSDGSAGAEIIAPLEIENTADLYFGTIAPSTSTDDIVAVGSDGSRKCGPALVCLTEDHTPATFKVTGEADYAYTITLPTDIVITSASGDTMTVSRFSGSQDRGELRDGTDSFTVGGTLAVAARQAAGQYRGAFTVTVEYN
ncbi:MAG: DUF4402 domain-containing protein [Erythrobacter sp.]|jgi:hypothetical protein|nr:DUF4402 domain-containing protein [Erythrobacter sp.]